jgi:putative addiction module component (TIGR02574 family)
LVTGDLSPPSPTQCHSAKGCDRSQPTKALTGQRTPNANCEITCLRLLLSPSPFPQFPFYFDIRPAMQSELTEQAKKLSIPDRILLVEEIWETIAEENQAFELTGAQKNELDRRLDSARANTAQGCTIGRTWDEIRAEFMKSR